MHKNTSSSHNFRVDKRTSAAVTVEWVVDYVALHQPQFVIQIDSALDENALCDWQVWLQVRAPACAAQKYRFLRLSIISVHQCSDDVYET